MCCHVSPIRTNGFCSMYCTIFNVVYNAVHDVPLCTVVWYLTGFVEVLFVFQCHMEKALSYIFVSITVILLIINCLWCLSYPS